MNIKSIKARANELIAYCKPQYIRVLVIMTVVGLIPHSVSSSGMSLILFLVLSVLFTPFKHGYIVSSLKIVRNNFHDLSDEDALNGLKRFKELFFTYFLYEFIVCVVLFLTISVIFIVLSILGIGVKNITSMLTVTVILSLIVSVVSALVGLYGFAFPYLLEKYGYKGMEAMKESVRFIEGHILDLFKLEISYLGWTLLVAFIQMFCVEVFAFLGTAGSVVASLASGVVALLTYLPQYYVSKAIFFEEIAYKHYPEYTSYESEVCVTEDNETEKQGENDVQ